MKRNIFIFFCFFLACTNPFNTRDPKPPSSDNQLQPINNLQNNPDSLFKQMQYAFQEPNWNYYEALLVDPTSFPIRFIFIPQQEAAYRLPGWTRQDELNYFRKLITDRSQNDLNLQIYNIQGPVQTGASQDTLQVQFSYQIRINLTVSKEYYEGQSIFKIFRSPQSLWYIYYWEDLKSGSDTADSTWSILKAAYR
jgi:hypothetical protein